MCKHRVVFDSPSRNLRIFESVEQKFARQITNCKVTDGGCSISLSKQSIPAPVTAMLIKFAPIDGRFQHFQPPNRWGRLQFNIIEFHISAGSQNAAIRNAYGFSGTEQNKVRISPGMVWQQCLTGIFKDISALLLHQPRDFRRQGKTKIVKQHNKIASLNLVDSVSRWNMKIVINFVES